MANDHDIGVLNTLITTTIDSANGYERSADDADGGQFQAMFRDYAQERRQVVGRLQERVRQLGGAPNDDGSLKADLHRRWVDLKSAIGGGSDNRGRRSFGIPAATGPADRSAQPARSRPGKMRRIEDRRDEAEPAGFRRRHIPVAEGLHAGGSRRPASDRPFRTSPPSH